MKDIDIETIRLMRKRIGISQSELSELAKVSIATIRQLEVGKHQPRRKTLSKILEAVRRAEKSHYPPKSVRFRLDKSAIERQGQPTVSVKVSSKYLSFVLKKKQYRIRWEDCSLLLTKATLEEKSNLRLSPSGYGIHWPLLDEDLSLINLMKKAEGSSK